MAATNPLVTSVLMVDLISWGLVATMRSRCSVPFDGVRGFVAWHSAFVLSIFDGGRGVSLEEVQGLSRWNIALRHSLWLSLPRRS